MGVRDLQVPDAAASPIAACPTLAAVLVEGLLQLGVRQAFGVSGGAMATLWHAMSASRLQVCHFRHESGAAFAAAEAHFVTGRPVLVFTTTGPGLTNALTGLLAARGEGAKVILLSACSSAASRGRFAIQETSPSTMPQSLYDSGPLFHFARVLEDSSSLPGLMHQLVQGLARRGGFMAHIALPTAVQAMPTEVPFRLFALGDALSAEAPDVPTPAMLHACQQALADGPFALWLGFGARGAAREVRAFAERTGAAVFCTPRGKGVLPEAHPQFIGVSGMGGHESVAAWVATHRPARILVLGSRLGEASSLFDPRFVPRRGFVHVDVNPEVPGVAYPDAATLPIAADVGALLRGLLASLPAGRHVSGATRPTLTCSPPTIVATTLVRSDCVRPEVLMDAIQCQVVDATEATLFAESGHAFIWATHRLRFATPGRYRVSTGFGAMGHATTGVVGAALASNAGPGCRAVALVGDGSMLMHNEINTAVKYAAPAVWIVLNDGRYGMCCQGM
ncbi:MAG TPA: thiamine pyrophosphate-binding protein, partial [Ideonella sp.]|uniref:thiamine pyrophosphate-binding protein n=1 Tax=Ideonella sp. TaxID=1929293 RepID=UPI002E35F367